MNIVLMAGGGGTRLWPLSLQETPKQFVDLGTGKSLIARAYERARELTEADTIYIATAQKYKDQVQKLVPEVPENHLFLEPMRRDTTAAFVHVCARLEAEGRGNEPTIFLWADHLFTNEKEFIADLKRIPDILASNPDTLVLVGHTPLNPNTALGYFRVGQPIAPHDDVFEVKEFIEKPERSKAEEFVAAGTYFWNLGYFSLRPSYLLQEIVSVSPDLSESVQALRAAAKEGSDTAIEEAFSQFPKQALEFSFVEKTKRIIAVTGDYGWSDVGNWKTVKEVFGIQGDHAPSGHHIHVDSENNYVYNTTDKVVSLIGVKGAIVVVTDKAVLIADEAQSHKVKQVVERIEQEGKKEYL